MPSDAKDLVWSLNVEMETAVTNLAAVYDKYEEAANLMVGQVND